MLNLSRKIIIASIAGIAATSAVFFFMTNGSHRAISAGEFGETNTSISSPPSDTAKSIDDDTKIIETLPNHKSRADEAIADTENAHQFSAALAAWKMDTGFDEGKILEYESYNMSALLEMGKSGDIYALQTFSKNLIENGDPLDGWAVNATASIHGSIKAIRDSASISSFLYTQLSEGKTKPEKASEFKRPSIDMGDLASSYRADAISGYILMALRGDIAGAEHELKLFNTKNPKYSITETEFTDLYLAAEEQIKMLNHRRDELGLPPLDTKVNPLTPFEIHSKYENIKSHLINTIGD